MRSLRRAPAALLFAASLAQAAPAPRSPPPDAGAPLAGAPAASGKIFWQENFDRAPLDWVDPVSPRASACASVYSLERAPAAAGPSRAPLSFLHARHDRSSRSQPPAIHYGKAFQTAGAPLDQVRALRWRWRVLQHPDVTDDPWIDVAASVYVIFRTPSILHSGRGFKFGWLAKPAPASHQRGLLEQPLRAGGPLGEWREESVDLCALYRREYHRDCAGETVQYIGVVTDADNTRSIAEGDYANFALELSAP